MNRRAPIRMQDEVICTGDCCQDAVRRAYREMRGKGEPETAALSAALAVFGWYHPEVANPRAQDTVTLWVHDGTMH
jgi:hypothetical protein